MSEFGKFRTVLRGQRSLKSFTVPRKVTFLTKGESLVTTRGIKGTPEEEEE